jgi:hypothetical protein
MPALVMAFLGYQDKPVVGGRRLGATIPAGLAALYALYAIMMLSYTLPRSDRGQIGIGLYLVIVAGFFLCLLAWVLAPAGAPVLAQPVQTHLRPKRKRFRTLAALGTGVLAVLLFCLIFLLQDRTDPRILGTWVRIGPADQFDGSVYRFSADNTFDVIYADGRPRIGQYTVLKNNQLRLHNPGGWIVYDYKVSQDGKTLTLSFAGSKGEYKRTMTRVDLFP